MKEQVTEARQLQYIWQDAILKCSGCGTSANAPETAMHEKACVRVIVDCPNGCGWEQPRQELDGHIQVHNEHVCVYLHLESK